MEIAKIREMINGGCVLWTAHAAERMEHRGIGRDDVRSAVNGGEIIEEYPDDYPYESCLIFGKAEDGRVIHVVVGSCEDMAYIITAYEPTLEKFEEDLRTRRKQ